MRWSISILFAVALVADVRAHDPGLSSAHVRIGPDRLTIHATFSPADVDTARRLRPSTEKLEALAFRAFEVKWGDEISRATATEVETDGGNVILETAYPARHPQPLTVRLALVCDLPPGHKQYIWVTLEDGKKLEEAILSRGADSISVGSVQLQTRATASQAGEFLVLGIEHIWTGYDHLAFLFGILLAGAGLRSALGVITSFTVAHSLTLALATAGMVVLSPPIAEPLIAASIIYVGVENLYRGGLKRRWAVTFGFGLVHGFGFASVLRDLGIGEGGGGMLVPLVSFNLGVEIGQAAVAALALPLLSKLQARPRFARLAPACSMLLTVAGGYWLAQRLPVADWLSSWGSWLQL